MMQLSQGSLWLQPLGATDLPLCLTAARNVFPASTPAAPFSHNSTDCSDKMWACEYHVRWFSAQEPGLKPL